MPWWTSSWEKSFIFLSNHLKSIIVKSEPPRLMVENSHTSNAYTKPTTLYYQPRVISIPGRKILFYLRLVMVRKLPRISGWSSAGRQSSRRRSVSVGWRASSDISGSNRLAESYAVTHKSLSNHSLSVLFEKSLKNQMEKKFHPRVRFPFFQLVQVSFFFKTDSFDAVFICTTNHLSILFIIVCYKTQCQRILFAISITIKN